MSVRVEWRRHGAALAAQAASLLRRARLADVTLVAGGRCLRAHRLLLAACSGLFADIFEENPYEHPIIVLNNISTEAMQAILFYIYNGEVSVSEDYLPTLIEAAEYLQIKGLSLDTENCNVEKIDPDENALIKEDEDIKSPDSTNLTRIPNDYANQEFDKEIVPKIEPLDDNVETIIRDGFESTLSVGENIDNGNCMNDVNVKHRSVAKKIKRKRNNIGKRHSKTCKRNNIIKTNKENENLPIDSDIFEQTKESVDLNYDKSVECTLFNKTLVDTLDEDDIHEDACFIEEGIKKDLKVRQTFPCPFCNRDYHSWGYRRRHIKTYHEKNSLSCKFCLIQLDSEVQWFDHIVKDHGISRSDARESLVIMVEAHTVLSSSSPPSPITMLNHLRLDVLPDIDNEDSSITNEESCDV